MHERKSWNQHSMPTPHLPCLLVCHTPMSLAARVGGGGGGGLNEELGRMKDMESQLGVSARQDQLLLALVPCVATDAQGSSDCTEKREEQETT